MNRGLICSVTNWVHEVFRATGDAKALNDEWEVFFVLLQTQKSTSNWAFDRLECVETQRFDNHVQELLQYTHCIQRCMLVQAGGEESSGIKFIVIRRESS